MERVEFGNGLQAMHFGDHRFNIKDVTTDVTPTARHISPGSEYFCLLSETLILQAI